MKETKTAHDKVLQNGVGESMEPLASKTQVVAMQSMLAISFVLVLFFIFVCLLMSIKRNRGY